GTVNASQSVNSVTLDTNSTTSGTLNLSAATGLNITVGAGQTAQYDGGVSLTTAGTGTATINGILKSSGGNATVTTNTFAMGASGAISDGSGTTTIKPASAESISVDGAGGALAITSTELGQITAGTLVVGDSSLSGGLTVAGSANLGTLGYNLTLNNAGNITANGQTTTIAGKTLTFNGTGASSVDPGAVNGNAGSVSVTAGSGGINLSGAINI